MTAAAVRAKKEGAALRFLYGTAPGRCALKMLTMPGLSEVCGRFLDSDASKALIEPFIQKNGIDLDDYVQEEYPSFNAFFSRRIKPERRPVEMDPDILIAPCDGFLSAYTLTGSSVFPVKHSAYTVSSLLKDDALAARYRDGLLLVFRLCVDNYHRYCYVDSGVKGENVFIPGRLHTVRPIALERFPVFTENAREYTVLQTDSFGDVVQMEVGALLVGKIENFHGPREVTRGEEKGRFLYGGSTVILLLEKGSAHVPEELFQKTRSGFETPVKLGQEIGRRGSLS